MRIVSGKHRGRILSAPKSQAIRPTADRLREALFNILTHSYDDPVEGARVLDLFAGTGALGLEALSRGAAFVLFVDDGAEARALLRGNVDALLPSELAHDDDISARDGSWFTPDALIVVEEAAASGFAAPAGFAEIERREYGDTQLVFLRRR